MFSFLEKVNLKSQPLISAYRQFLLVVMPSGIYRSCVFELSVNRETDHDVSKVFGCLGETGVTYQIDGP